MNPLVRPLPNYRKALASERSTKERKWKLLLYADTRQVPDRASQPTGQPSGPVAEHPCPDSESAAEPVRQ